MEVHLKDLFTRFQHQFGTGPGLGPSTGTCLLKVEGISPSFIKFLFRASAALYRTEPWKRLRSGHLFSIRIGKDSDWSSKKQPFPVTQFIGGEGGDLGLHMFKSEVDAQKTTGLRETNRVPNVELLRVIFEPEPVLFPSNKRMIRSLSLESSGSDRFPIIDVARFTSSGGVRFRNPTLEELRYVYAFLKAIALVHPLLQLANDGSPRKGRMVSFDPFIETVDVQWPPEVSKGGDLVAVTISHPPGQVYEEKKRARTPSPSKYMEPPKEELTSMEVRSNWIALRKCSMCEKEVHGDETICCGRCRAVVYCSPLCQKQHWKEAHKSVCGLYKAMMEREEELAMNIFTFPCFVDHPCKWLETTGLHQKGMWRRRCGCYSHYPFGLLPLKSSGGASDSWGGLKDGEYPPDIPFHNYRDVVSNPMLLSGWSEYYNLRCLPFSSPAVDLLSHPLTVYHILTTLISSKNRLIKGKEVILHYLGPEGELDWMTAFAEISYLLNGSGNIQIVMIGPEVPSNLSGTVSGIGGRVRVNLVRGLYQEQAPRLPPPHVVVALNCGLENYGSWGGALEVIKSSGVPTFFTDRSEISCTNSKQVLRAAALQISHPVMPNPFRSPVQDRAPSTNLPSFSNGFVFGVNT